MSTVLRSDYLHYQAGNSDKVYRMRLIQETDGMCAIIAEYGRRGSVLKTINKGSYTRYEPAEREYYQLLDEKIQKGYKNANVAQESAF